MWFILSGGAVDSGGGFRTGFHWAAVDSFRGPAEATPEGGQSLVLLGYSGRAGGHWIPGGFPKKRGCR